MRYTDHERPCILRRLPDDQPRRTEDNWRRQRLRRLGLGLRPPLYRVLLALQTVPASRDVRLADLRPTARQLLADLHTALPALAQQLGSHALEILTGATDAAVDPWNLHDIQQFVRKLLAGHQAAGRLAPMRPGQQWAAKALFELHGQCLRQVAGWLGDCVLACLDPIALETLLEPQGSGQRLTLDLMPVWPAEAGALVDWLYQTEGKPCGPP